MPIFFFHLVWPIWRLFGIVAAEFFIAWNGSKMLGTKAHERVEIAETFIWLFTDQNKGIRWACYFRLSIWLLCGKGEILVRRRISPIEIQPQISNWSRSLDSLWERTRVDQKVGQRERLKSIAFWAPLGSEGSFVSRTLEELACHKTNSHQQVANSSNSPAYLTTRQETKHTHTLRQSSAVR